MQPINTGCKPKFSSGAITYICKTIVIYLCYLFLVFFESGMGDLVMQAA